MGRGFESRTTRKLLLGSASVLALGVVVMPGAPAQTCGAGAGRLITTACDAPFDWTGGDLALTGTGTISGASTGVTVATGVGTLSNAGSIVGSQYGIYNLGNIASIANDGSIGGLYGIGNGSAGQIGMLLNVRWLQGVENNGSVDLLYNAAGASIAGRILNSGTITDLNNEGVIDSGPGSTAISNSGRIGTLTNTGLITSSGYAIWNDSTGTIVLVNPGTIAGNIVNSGALTISGGFGGTIGTLTGVGGSLGTIDGSFDFGSGALRLDDVINGVVTVVGSGGTLYNTGTIGGDNGGLVVGSGASLDLLSNTGVIRSTSTIASAFSNAGSIGTLLNSGGISGTTNAVVNTGTIEEFTNGGTITTGVLYTAVVQSGSVGTLTNTGNISAGKLIINTGAIGTLTNSGSMTASRQWAVNNSGGTITSLENSADITARERAILNSGTIGFLTNTHLISGSIGISNSGSISTIDNSGLINTHTLSGGNAILNSGWIGQFTNSGTIAALGTGIDANGILNSGTIDLIDNSGLISGSEASYGELPDDGNGIYVTGSVGQIVNTGTIEGYRGIMVDATGTIGTITNSGTISTHPHHGSFDAVYNAGSISALTNTGTIQGLLNFGGTIDRLENWDGGTINGIFSVDSTGPASVASIGSLLNEGVISGDIYTQHAIRVEGGFATFGTLTGGTISGDLEFTGGKLLLDDDGVGAHLANSGATLRVDRTLTIGSTYDNATLGSFSQSSGTLQFGTLGGLVVSGAATFTGGTIAVGEDATGNYSFGQTRTIIAADDTSSYTGATVTMTVVGLTYSKATTGGDLVFTYTDDYIGGTLASFTESRSIAGGQYAIYVAATGNVGTLTNSGALVGTTAALFNTGAIGELDNLAAGTIGGTIATGLHNSRIIGTIVNAGTIRGNLEALRNNGGTIGLIRNEGLLTSTGMAVRNTGSIGTIANTQTILGQIYNTGIIGLIDNSARMTGYGVVISSAGTIGTIRNTGTILNAYSSAAITISAGTIGTLSNSGIISGLAALSVPGGRIGELLNSGTMSGITLTGGTILNLSNTGDIDATRWGIDNDTGFIDNLTNAAGGTISGSSAAIRNTGGISTLANSGTIGSSGYGLDNSGNVTSITNSGTISGNTGLYNTGTIGTLSNSGLITGSTYAINNSGTALIVNSGTIAGGIQNTGDLTISGGSGGTFGTLTGLNGSMGTFSGTFNFGTGALALNDVIASGVIVAGTGGTISNSGTIGGGSAGYGLSVSAGASLDKLDNTGTIARSGAAIYAAGNIGTLTNSGLLDTPNGGINTAATAVINRIVNQAGATINASWALYNNGHVGTLINAGTLKASRIGINNRAGGIIDAIENTGYIDSADRGIVNSSSIVSITNSGTIVGNGEIGIGIANAGSIGTITNHGLISGVSRAHPVPEAGTGVYVVGTIQEISNYGTIEGDRVGIAVALPGTIGTLNNMGLITGPANALVNTGSMLLVNAGTIAGDIDSTGDLTISGGSNGAVGTLTGLDGSIGIFSGSALIFDTGALVLNDFIAQGVTVVGMGGSLTNTGSIGTISGVNIGSLASLDSFTNSGEVTAGTGAVFNYGLIGTVTNSGSLTASAGIANAGTIIEIVNTETGTIISTGGSAWAAGILNWGGSIGSIGNSGLVSVTATGLGVANEGTISVLTNSGTISALGGGPAIVNILGSIVSLNNSGEIIGGGVIAGMTYAALENHDAMGVLTNSGTITGLGGSAVDNTGSIAAVINTGTVTGRIAVQNDGTIGSISNGGTIKATGFFGLLNNGTILELSNSRLLEGGNGLWNWGRIDSFVNSGTINGTTSAGLGNTTGTIGTLSNSGLITGKYSAIGNSGTLSIVNTGTIAGDIVNNGHLTISGGANGVFGTLTGLNGALAAVTGNSLNFDTGALEVHAVFARTLEVTGTGGTLSNTGTINTLAVASGAGLARLMNSGTIAVGITTAAAIHNLGTIGVISNSGVIQGNIDSASTLNFGGNTAPGTLTGGTITAPSVDFTSGSMVLADDIAGDTRISGGRVTLASGADLLGNYSQSAGTLDFSALGTLTISGTASISGGTVVASGLSASGNYFAGDHGGTIIDASAGSSYAGATVEFDGLTGLTAGADTSNTEDLVVVYRNDYIGGSFDTFGNSGTISGSGYGFYVGSTGNIGTFANTGSLGGSTDAFYNGGTIGVLNNSGAIADGTGLHNTGSIGVLNNSGLIEGDSGINNSGTIGSINNSGTITGPDYAIYNTGVLGPITNTGLINGNIHTTGVLELAGGGGSSFGTLSGGTITAAGVSIASGNVVLGDHVNLGSGTLNAGTAAVELPSRITITGNYLQTGGVLISDVNGATTYGSMVVTGGATITNTTIRVSGSAVRAGRSYTIVDAGAASSYAGDTLELVGAHYRARLITVGDDLVASIRAMFSEVGNAKGGSAAIMGGVLEQLSEVDSMLPTIDTLSLLPDEDLGNALEQAAPAEVGGSTASLQRAALIEDLIGGAVGARTRQAGPGWTVWAEGIGGMARRDATAGAAGYDMSVLGMVIGADSLAAEGVVVGGALSWSAGYNTGQASLSGNANAMNSLQLLGYAGLTHGALTLTAQAGFGFNLYDQRREMPHLGKTARAEYTGRQYTMALDGGYELPLGEGLTLTPTASLRWLRLASGGYTEEGAGVDGLVVSATIADQVQSALGAKLAWDLETNLGRVVPELRVSWLHDLLDDPGETPAVLGGLSFTTTSARISANGIRLGTGLTFYYSDATSLRLEYDGEFRDDYTAHGGMLQLALRL